MVSRDIALRHRQSLVFPISSFTYTSSLAAASAPIAPNPSQPTLPPSHPLCPPAHSLSFSLSLSHTPPASPFVAPCVFLFVRAAFAHQTKEDASGFWWVRELDVTHIATYLLNEEGVYHQRLADNLNMLTVANALTLTVTATLASGAGFFDPNTKNDSDDRTWRAVQYLMIIATVIEVSL